MWGQAALEVVALLIPRNLEKIHEQNILII